MADRSFSALGYKLVAVISCFRFLKAHAVFIAKLLDFILCKTKIFCQFARICHGVFGKRIEGGVCAVIFDWQDSGHIGKRNIILILQPHAEEVEVFLLCVRVVGVFTEQAVPFVYKDYEMAFCFRIYIF